MNNKSREKIVGKPPTASSKIGSTINRVPLKPAESMLPIIKVNKDIINKKPSLNKSANKTGELVQRASSKKIQTSLGYKKNVNKEKALYDKVGWDRLPLNLLLQISQFCSELPFDVYKLSLVCSIWRQLMECQNAVYFWKRFKKTQGARNFRQFKNCLQGDLIQLKQKRSVEFETMFAKLFNYGSTKENIPNKLISKLKLQIQVTINKKKYALYPYKLRNFNFSSYLYAKISQLNQIPFDMYTPHNFFKDKLQITIAFYSRTYKVSHVLNYKYKPQEIAECAIKSKAFNYFIDKNLIITFFEGDKTFLYCFLEISVLELITQFRKVIKANFQEHIDKKTKKVPMYKKLCETQFQNFLQYLKYQADFELHMSYHNSIKQIFTHCDTKVYPVEYDSKSAYFDVPINDTFNKTSTFLLDNKMGMSQNIEDLYLLDFVLKDRDRFLIVFSGFIYARNALQKERQSIQNYFQFAQLPMKLLQFKADKYSFSILIVQQAKKNLIKHARFTICP